MMKVLPSLGEPWLTPTPISCAPLAINLPLKANAALSHGLVPEVSSCPFPTPLESAVLQHG